ncbi:energy transducer TonB [Pelobacter seleniigenes]|uniref:energy transducer TonB n=1 Tax=Pelobacter seleniigenes TaxID=407188 RepID=UPI0004A71EB3|nr:energy transducer TonB [Pelobacter seleniigenes]
MPGNDRRLELVHACRNRALLQLCCSKLEAGAVAIGMTFLLFAVLPLALHPGSAPILSPQVVEPIAVIRLSPPPSPPERQQRPKPESSRSEAVKALPKRAFQPLQAQSLTLPLALNPQLTDLPMVPDLPAATFPESVGDFAVPEVFDVGDLDQPLMALARQQPLYPFYAKQRRIEGAVRVRFIVNKEGRVENISIVDAKPAEVFEESVIHCVSSWRFRPGTIDGVAVSSWAETTIRFVLK